MARHRFEAFQAVVHPRYTKQKEDVNVSMVGRDIGLIELNREVEIRFQKLMPSCLPPGPGFPDNTGWLFGNIVSKL